MKKRRWKILFLLIVVLITATERSRAIGHPTTRRSGLVQSVDQTRHTFTLLPDGESKPVVIEWRNKSGAFTGQKTEFFTGEAPASEAILKANIRVQVRYVEALFATNSAVLVRWLDPRPTPRP